MKYRKKPVVIEAFQTDKEVIIHTLEGDMKASVGDYIITGVDGEQYPCKPDIFHKTYEPVSNTNFDRIKAMSVEEMAEHIYLHDDRLNDVVCKTMHKHCPFGDNVTPQNCVSCVKKWLESEVQGE